jgi:hypothetical protein
MNNVFIKNFPWNTERLQFIKDYEIISPFNIHSVWNSKDGMLTIINDKWIIKKGYQYDDCTWVPSGDIDNTPNLPVISLTNQPIYILWRASGCHDIGYDNLDDPTFPFVKKDIDLFFYIECCKTNFKYYKEYYYGVIILGGPFHYIGKFFKYIKRLLKIGVLY